MPIQSYADKRSADFAAGQRIKEFQSVERQIIKGLTKLTVAERLVELRYPPSNRFQALGGDRKDQYSIRVNDRWRICFRWVLRDNATGQDPMMMLGDAFDVTIVDYH